MKKKIKILFTSVGRRVELLQRFRAASEQTGIALELYGVDITASAPALSICDHRFLVPRITDPAYIPALLKICRDENIDAIIPTIDTDLLLLSEKKEEFAEIGTLALISRREKIAVCRDKRLTADYFRSVGLSSPQPVDDAEKYSQGFPAFIKPRDGSSSIGAHRVNDQEELLAYSREVPDYIIQPFIEGTEYTVDIFCDFDGNPVYITPRIRQAVRAGEVLKTKICQDDQIISEMRQLIRDFRPCGPITVQLIRDNKTGIDWYIEINPRFGGGAPLSMKAGADAADAVLRLLAGEQVSYRERAAEDGAVYSRFDQSVCIEPGQPLPQQLEAVIFDLDDTLYPEKDYVRSGYHAASAFLPEIENAEEALWQAFLNGKPAFDTVLQNAGLYSPDRKEKCLKAYREHIPQIRLYPEMKELLLALRTKGIRTGVLTDGRPEGQKNKIRALGLKELVDEILITDELGGPRFRKPNDIGFRILKYRLGTAFERMVYVGDNPRKDFQAPGMLGMSYIYFRNPEGLYSSCEVAVPFTACTAAEVKEMLLGE